MPAIRPIVRRAVQIGTLTAATVGVVSAGYKRYADIKGRGRYPPPGQLVDIGGRRLHVWRMGTGGPAVVIEASLGGSVVEWAGIQRVLADTTTVVTYDRAGLGWSDPDLRPRTAARMANDLHRLLQAAAIPPPYLLVGHSIGGYVVRLYAAHRPEDVAGVILAESSHPDQWQRLVALGQRRYTASRMLLDMIVGVLEPDGLYRLVGDLGLTPHRRQRRRATAEQRYPPDLVDAALAVNQRWLHAGYNEWLWIRRSCAQVRSQASTLGDLPLLVLVADRGDKHDDERALWEELQADHAALSTRSTYLVTPDAGHHLHRDNPEFVLTALRDMVKQARASR